MAGTRSGPGIIVGERLGSNGPVLMDCHADSPVGLPHDTSARLNGTVREIIRPRIAQGAQDS